MEETQEINLEQLEENYGAELVEKLKSHIERAHEKNWKFKVEVVDETKCFAEIAFVNDGFAYIYEVMLKDKSIVSKNFIGSGACKNVLKAMNSFN